MIDENENGNFSPATRPVRNEGGSKRWLFAHPSVAMRVTDTRKWAWEGRPQAERILIQGFSVTGNHYVTYPHLLPRRPLPIMQKGIHFNTRRKSDQEHGAGLISEAAQIPHQCSNPTS